ncbi:hypothetical protein VTN77DRAFT_1355 [Rasamsonia byssochlamydoides]|uniref:uncharacterized protein n=1 Tax=Rasamsonia byssochlamydoides TaxID=89139 RepID=UPI0037424FBC
MRLKSLTDIKSIKPLKRVKSETDVPRAKLHRRRRSISGDWHYLSSVSSSEDPPQRQMFIRRVLSFGTKGHPRSPPLSPSPFPFSTNVFLRGDAIIQSMLPSTSMMKRKTSLPGTKAQAEPGTLQNPIFEFKGGSAWMELNAEQPELWIDLFWPIPLDASDDEEDMLNIEELKPLCSFRNLRVLKLTGMMQSYQKYIWQAAWLNHDLETLVLEMALEPRIADHLKRAWPVIKDDWTPRARASEHWDDL